MSPNLDSKTKKYKFPPKSNEQPTRVQFQRQKHRTLQQNLKEKSERDSVNTGNGELPDV